MTIAKHNGRLEFTVLIPLRPRMDNRRHGMTQT